MIRKPFFGSGKPKLKYSVIGIHEKETLAEVHLPSKAFLHVKGSFGSIDELRVRLGEKVRTGQKLRLTSQNSRPFISPVTGTIKSITPQIGHLGEAYTSVAVEVAKDEWDNEFSKSAQAATIQNAQTFFHSLPGQPDFGALLGTQPPLRTFVITGMDKDLLMTTNQLVAKAERENLEQGIALLQKITGAEKMILLLPSPLADQMKSHGVEVKGIDLSYPYALPPLVMKRVLGREVLAGKRCEDMGVGFVSAEAMAALGGAFVNGRMPVHKLLTVIRKDGSRINARARIGTPVKDVLNALQIGAAHGDRVVLGGPMAGRSAFSEDTPVQYDTDGLMVQDEKDIVKSSDTHCVNCGECVRACPAKIPVNMLIRFLENGLWEDAVHQYDLLSCVECGLCTYVCISRIPIFQYIMLGKHEFSRMESLEDSHA